MIAITTKSSINVNPAAARFERNGSVGQIRCGFIGIPSFAIIRTPLGFCRVRFHALGIARWGECPDEPIQPCLKPDPEHPEAGVPTYNQRRIGRACCCAQNTYE